jgi:hypothetical protein
MKKTIKLTEADLRRIVKRVIKESMEDNDHSDRFHPDYKDDNELIEIVIDKVQNIAHNLDFYPQYHDIMDQIDDGNDSDDDFDSYENQLKNMGKDLMHEIESLDDPTIDKQMKEMMIQYAEEIIDDIFGELSVEYKKAQKRAGTLPPNTKWSYPSDFKGGVDEQMEDGDDEPLNVTDSSKIKLSDAKFEKLIDKVYEDFGNKSYEMAENLRHEIYSNDDKYDEEMDQMYEEKFNQEAGKLFDQYMGRIMDKFDLNSDQMDDLTNTMDDILRDAFTG